MRWTVILLGLVVMANAASLRPIERQSGAADGTGFTDCMNPQIWSRNVVCILQSPRRNGVRLVLTVITITANQQLSA